MRTLVVAGFFLMTLAPAVFTEPMVVKSIATTAMPDHIMVVGGPTQWVDGPDALPKGVKSAVIEGDPAMPGPFTMRARMPAGYTIPPHSHPADEHVTVLSGSLSMGLGDTLNKAAATELTPGSFAMMAQGTHHYAFSRNGADIQIHGIGPWGIIYVNPKDDPRLKK